MDENHTQHSSHSCGQRGERWARSASTPPTPLVFNKRGGNVPTQAPVTYHTHSALIASPAQ